MLKAKQIAKAQGGATNEKKRLALAEAIEELRVRQELLVMNVNQSFERIQHSLEALTRVTNALVAIMGAETVQKTVEKQRIDELEAAAAAATAAVAAAVERGELKPGEAIDNDQALVVTSQFDPEGKQLHPVAMTVPLAGYRPHVIEALRGKKVGDTVVLEDGSKVEVKAVYVPVPDDQRPKQADPEALPAEATSADPEATGA